jgi:hypothetical protein
MQVIHRTVDAYTEVNKRTGICRAIVSDDSRDRYRTVFDPEGCEWSGWRDGGSCVLYEHGKEGRGKLPVGNVVEGPELTTFRGRRSIITGTRFWDTDPFAKQVGDAYRSMAMKGWSINAIPHVQSPPTPGERRARADWSDTEMVYRRWELAELSVTALPGNVNCVTQEVIRSARGLARPAAEVNRELTALIMRLYGTTRDQGYRDLEAEIMALLGTKSDQEKMRLTQRLENHFSVLVAKNKTENLASYLASKKQYADAAAQREREKYGRDQEKFGYSRPSPGPREPYLGSDQWIDDMATGGMKKAAGKA